MGREWCDRLWPPARSQNLPVSRAGVRRDPPATRGGGARVSPTGRRTVRCPGKPAAQARWRTGRSGHVQQSERRDRRCRRFADRGPRAACPTTRRRIAPSSRRALRQRLDLRCSDPSHRAAEIHSDRHAIEPHGPSTRVRIACGLAMQLLVQTTARVCPVWSQIDAPGGRIGAPFRPTAPIRFRTHVPQADDTPTEQPLAPRAGARCRGNRTGVRDAGRGKARFRTGPGGGATASRDLDTWSGRPHRRAPAPSANSSSATRAPRRQHRPACAGLPLAGTSPGNTAALTARRRPVWEDGSAGRPGALPGAPDFIALGPPSPGGPSAVPPHPPPHHGPAGLTTVGAHEQPSARNGDEPPGGRLVAIKKPAATYSPRPFQAKYHRRGGA
jgi:hypothetical protein